MGDQVCFRQKHVYKLIIDPRAKYCTTKFQATADHELCNGPMCTAYRVTTQLILDAMCRELARLDRIHKRPGTRSKEFMKNILK